MPDASPPCRLPRERRQERGRPTTPPKVAPEAALQHPFAPWRDRGPHAAPSGRTPPPESPSSPSSHRSTPLSAILILLLLLLFTPALAQTATTVTVEREDAIFTIRNLGLSADGARSFFQNPNCDDDARLDIFYAPSPGRIETEVDDGTLMTSGVAIVRRPNDDGEGGEGGDDGDGETIELFNAEVTFDRPRCPEEVVPLETPPVTLTQGRTTATGSRFVLEPGSDTGVMSGPVELERAAEGDSPALSGTADELTFDLESDRTTLIGGVTLISEGRTSEAERLELDEGAGVAILTGSPARSTEDGNTLEGERLIYYLDTNDVVVEGGVRGLVEFE